MVYLPSDVVNRRRKRPKFGKEATMTGCIVGWAHTPFGKLDAESVESLIVRVATGALADAGVFAPASVNGATTMAWPARA